MTITSIGYDGTVQETDWAYLSRLLGTDAAAYAVTGTTGDMRCRIAGTGTRPVTVGPGRLFGSGIMDNNSADVVLNPAALASGIRWDTVCMDRNWAGSGGTSTLVIRSGTSTKAITLANTTPGVREDQPIALIKLDSTFTAVQQIIDLRAQAEKLKIYATEEAVLVQPPFGMAYALDTGHHYLATATGWVDLQKPVWTNITLPSSVVQFAFAPRFTKMGGVVYLQGGYSKTDGTNFVGGGGTGGAYSLGNLPVGFRPGQNLAFTVDHGYTTADTKVFRVNVSSAGVITGVPSGDIAAMRIDGISFPAEN